MSFWDQFKAAIYSNVKLNIIDKFNYFIYYLKNEPPDTIHGLTLSSENYARAVDILHERYGNKQISMSSLVDVLVKSPRVASLSDIPNLRKILNLLSASIRNMEMNSCGTLLISTIFGRIPNQLRIIISQKFKKYVWDLRNLTDIFKQKLFARERCYAIQKNAENHVPKDSLFTGHPLLSHPQEKENPN